MCDPTKDFVISVLIFKYLEDNIFFIVFIWSKIQQKQ